MRLESGFDKAYLKESFDLYPALKDRDQEDQEDQDCDDIVPGDLWKGNTDIN
jgi:hypothetical protein